MKVVICAIVLVAVFARCASCQKLKQCRERCITKIPDIQLCNETCVQLVNSSSVSNITASPPVPDSPRLLSSTYFTLTLQWNDYSKTKYNASPVVYVLETTRHKNSSDPGIILPAIKKYHTTNTTTFTIPEQFVTKTNFSFRLAVVTVQGTSDFSPPSPLYVTNDTCDRSPHVFTSGAFNPCPIFNVRINFTATEVLFQRPRISSILFWDYPHDITNLEGQLELEVTLSRRFPYTREQECADSGTTLYNDFISLHNQSKSEIYHLPPDPKEQFYFGCPYDVTLRSEYGHKFFKAVATFYVPHCIHGFCGCDFVTTNAAKRESEYIDVDVRQSNHSENRTTANVTWRNEAWGTKVPEYFRLTILKCTRGTCPSPHLNHKREILPADRMKTSHSFNLQNLTKGEEHWVTIAAYDKNGCLLSPIEGQLFDAIVPPPTTAATNTTEPSTEYPTVEPRTLLPSPDTPSILSSPATPSTGSGQTTPVTSTAKEGLSSATVAAITVPIVLLLLAGLAVVLLFYFRFHRKPHRLHRDPTGLRRLADHMRDNDRDIYQRNRQHDLSSPYSSDYDRSELVVNLPLKSEGGLELNPAYVEQRIQEAVETGEADEFEFGYHRLELKRVLGKGAFGKVYLAEAYGIGGSQETSLVAVKVLNEKANEDEKEDFKMEINFMKTIGRHENVLTMLGCCTLYPPLCLVVEYVPHGDLLHYLRNLRKTFEMQNRKLQGDDIGKLKKDAKNTSLSSETQITGADSAMGQGSYSRRPLVPSVSDTKKYEKFFEADELAKLKRTNSASSFVTLSPPSLFSPRRASEIPQVHYVTRGPTDVSNNTETTLVSDTKSAANTQPFSPSRTMGLDGALDSSDLQSFALQIANGMAYLAGKGVIHRDLAARNILVGDEKVLKISDFGLSREGIYVKRSTGKIPLRWLSTEAMRERIYSTASDIWAFGIVLWEICTLGGFPYPTLNDRDLLDFLLDGSRMDKPDNCTDEIYQIMLACWARDCEDRPSFQSLSEQLFDMQKEEHPYVNVDPSQDFILPPTAGQDTVGNLIAFSDGTFSGATADQELPSPATLPNPLNPGQISLGVLSDAENPGYESSSASSKEDLSVSDAKAADNDIIQFSPPGGSANDIEDSPV